MNPLRLNPARTAVLRISEHDLLLALWQYHGAGPPPVGWEIDAVWQDGDDVVLKCRTRDGHPNTTDRHAS